MKKIKLLIIEKISIISIILTLVFNCIIPNRAYAFSLDTAAGLVLEPFVEFATSFVDSIMTILTNVMTGNDMEFVMQKDPINETEEGTNFPIDDLSPYKNLFGVMDIKYPNFAYSPEEIFTGEIQLLNADFMTESSGEGTLGEIRDVISTWYKALRLFSVVGLLSVLIYTGIKIIISSAASDKAKYKERIINWFIAFALLFVMHYIMAFIVMLIQEITLLFSNMSGIIKVTMSDGTTFTTNLIGLARFQMQQQEFSRKIAFLVIYVALVTFTFKFTLLYLKRTLKVAFLTLIAPIVALMYPLDKMEGKAKGFQLWLKEYIYNILLQPMHYLLYYILVSSSMFLAANNPIYAIVAILFVSEAEKLLKKIFGFNRARGGTVGGLAGAYATTSIVSTMTNFLQGGSKSGKGKNSLSSGNSGDGDDEDDLPEDSKNDFNIDSLIDSDEENRIDNEGSQEENNNSNNSRNQEDSSSDTDTDSFWKKYREKIANMFSGMPQFAFNDGDSRGFDAILNQIMQNQQALSGLAIDDPRRQALEKDIARDMNILNNRTEGNNLGFNFNDGDSRSFEDILKQIKQNQDKLKGLAIDDPRRRALENDIFRDMNILKNRIGNNKELFSGNNWPLKFDDGDSRSYQDIIDQIMQNKQSLNGLSSNDPKRARLEKEIVRDKNLLKNRVEANEEPLVSKNIPLQYNDKDTRTNEQINSDIIKNAEKLSSLTHEEWKQQGYEEKLKHDTKLLNQRMKENSVIEKELQRKAKSAQGKEKRKITGIERVALGVTEVAKSGINPIWHTDKKVKTNLERLVGKGIKTAAGVTLGVTAAAVQAGISITDGKYNALEGVASFTGGAVAGAHVVDKIKDSFNGNENIQQYSDRWYDRDDTIKNFKNEYGLDAKQMRERARDNYVIRGIVDFKEQKQAIKFANELMKEGKTQDEADRLAVATLEYKKTLIREKTYGMLYDSKKMDKYLDSVTERYTGKASKEAVRNKHMDLIDYVIQFDMIND